MRIFLAMVLFLVLLSSCTLSDDGVLTIRTADPQVNLAFQLPPPAESLLLPTITPEPDMSPEVIPADEVGEIVPEPTLEPPSQDIKGNISSSGEKIYHVPGGAYYDQVKIDEENGEMWFRTEEEAVAAGWRKSSR